MFKHIILCKFNSSITEDGCLDLLAELGMLQTQIPSIVSYHFGKNDADNAHNKGFDYAFVMTFASKQDRSAYQHHIAHQQFIQTRLEPVLDDAIVFDLETSTNLVRE